MAVILHAAHACILGIIKSKQISTFIRCPYDQIGILKGAGNVWGKKFTERHASLHKPEKRTVTNEQ